MLNGTILPVEGVFCYFHDIIPGVNRVERTLNLALCNWFVDSNEYMNFNNQQIINFCLKGV